MKKFQILLLALSILCLNQACSYRESGKDKNVTARQLKSPKHGITIDAHYDPRLDNLIPGYKILTVGLTNQSVDILRLNPLRDRWEIVDAYGRKQKAITSLRIKDPQTFGKLPDKLQEMVDYPVGVSVNYTETVDLFFPKNVDLSAFRAISFYNFDRKHTFDMLANMQSETHVPINQNQAPETDPRFMKQPKLN